MTSGTERVKVICRLEKEPLKGFANVQEIFSSPISLVEIIFIIEVPRTSIHIICCYYIRIVRQVTCLLLINLHKNKVKKSIWKFIDIFPNQVLNFFKTSSVSMEIYLQITQKA